MFAHTDWWPAVDSPGQLSLVLECTVAWVCGQDRLTWAFMTISTFGPCSSWVLRRSQVSKQKNYTSINWSIIFCLTWEILIRQHFCLSVLLSVLRTPAPWWFGLTSLHSEQQYYFSYYPAFIRFLSFLLHPHFLLFPFFLVSLSFLFSLANKSCVLESPASNIV